MFSCKEECTEMGKFLDRVETSEDIVFKWERPMAVYKATEGTELRKKKLNIQERQGSQKERHGTQIRGLA